MTADALARSFESIGDDYDRYRPGFPDEAAQIIVPVRVATALDLGAGTGKFTILLVDRADRVIAVEPSRPMLDVLRARSPRAEALIGSAERIPVPEGAVDVVTVAQAFHWFDREAASAEIARILVPGGVLGLLWNRSDPSCAWDRASHRIAHPAVGDSDGTTDSATELPGFVPVSREQVRWTETLTREHYLRRWTTISSFLVAEASERARMTAEIKAVLDADPDTRGRAELVLPQVTDVFVYRRA
ncbi:class I SAM-dependent methyltransferase [Microbacterium sp. 179-I 3D2 NHS]|uniref:class I SAM-dependent methyltransferase n=1 Tax=Microbacterium sp. 179-I 3D2 NHS TaxID=3235178 RepID=UPI00399FB043